MQCSVTLWLLFAVGLTDLSQPGVSHKFHHAQAKATAMHLDRSSHSPEYYSLAGPVLSLCVCVNAASYTSGVHFISCVRVSHRRVNLYIVLNGFPVHLYILSLNAHTRLRYQTYPTLHIHPILGHGRSAAFLRLGHIIMREYAGAQNPAAAPHSCSSTFPTWLKCIAVTLVTSKLEL